MSDPLRNYHVPQDGLSERDRAVKVEQLLLSGLEHYFQRKYERAIEVWSRVLFIERSHARAHAYIARARAALAERLRESEELVHTGVAAFERGDVTKARSLLTLAIDRGGGREEAFTVLDRLNRLEAASGVSPEFFIESSPPSLIEQTRSGPADGLGKRVRVAPLVLFMGVLIAASYLAMSWVQWEMLMPGRVLPSMAVPATTMNEALPVLSGAEIKVRRARLLIFDGRFVDALDLLNTVGLGDPISEEVDLLRAWIQRRLLSVEEESVTDIESGVVRAQ